MSKNSVEISNKMSEVTKEQTLDEMRLHVITAAGVRDMGETIERCIERAARRLGFTFARAKSFWNRTARSVEAHEIINARQRIAAMEQLYEKKRLELVQTKAGAVLANAENRVPNRSN